MKKPKKEGNRHLLAAYSKEALEELAVRLKLASVTIYDRCRILIKRLCQNKEKTDNGLEQITMLREVGNALQASMQEAMLNEEANIILDLLAFLFIKCKSKHPARRTIASILSGVPENGSTVAVDCLVKNFLAELQLFDAGKKFNEQDFPSAFRNVVDTVMAFNENFSIGKLVVLRCSNAVLQLLEGGLRKELSRIRSTSSIDAQTTAMLNCLSALKATIVVLHYNHWTDNNRESPSDPTSTQGSPQADHRRQCQHVNYKSFANTLSSILQLAFDILNDANFMLDCRNTAGICVVSILQFLLPSRILRKLINALISEAHVESHFESLVNEENGLLTSRTDFAAFNERSVIEIVREYCLTQMSCSFSRLIICHGLITKLDANILHGGEWLVVDRSSPIRKFLDAQSNCTASRIKDSNSSGSDAADEVFASKLAEEECLTEFLEYEIEKIKISAEEKVTEIQPPKVDLEGQVNGFENKDLQEKKTSAAIQQKDDQSTDGLLHAVKIADTGGKDFRVENTRTKTQHRDRQSADFVIQVEGTRTKTRNNENEQELGNASEISGGNPSPPVCPEKTANLFATSVLDCLLKVCATVNEKGLTVYAFKTLFYWTSEAHNQCKRLINDQNLTDLKLYSPNGGITINLLQTFNSFIDHPIDAVRHQVRNSLEKIIRILNLFQDSESYIRSLLLNWLQGSLRVRSKCLSLNCVLDYINVERLLEIRVNLPLDLLDCFSDSNLGSHICDLYVKAATKHKTGLSDIDDWIRIWCEPVFKALSSSERLKRTFLTDYIIPGLLKAFPDLIRIILYRSRILEDSEDYIVASVVFLASAKNMRECARVKLDDEKMEGAEYWHGLIPMQFMELCLCHRDEKVRQDCLALICESNKSTEILDRHDFELLKFFIPLNMRSQSPQFRSHFVCSMKKAVSRVYERCRQVRKSLEVDGTSNVGTVLGQVKQKREKTAQDELTQYRDFLTWLMEFLFANLHSDSCFPRLVTALEIMSTVLRVILPMGITFSETEAAAKSDKTMSDSLQLPVKEIFNKANIQTLIGCLYDSFDSNRLLANEILSLLPHDLYEFTESEIIAIFEEAMYLAYSPQPDNTNVAPYLIKLLANENLKNSVAESLKNKHQGLNKLHHDCYYHTHLVILRILLSKTNDQVTIAGQQLSDAASDAPMHGTLHCIRELLATIEIDKIKDRPNWRVSVNELVELCYRVTNVVGPITQSNAPEGYSDEDQSILVPQAADLNDVTKRDVETQAHLSQMLLVCCWRSMKESVLLLSEIASRFPVFESGSQSKYDVSARGKVTNCNESDGVNRGEIETDKEATWSSKQGMRLAMGTVGYSVSLTANRVKQSVSKEGRRGPGTILTRTQESVIDETEDSLGYISSQTVINISHVLTDTLLSSRHNGAFELAYLGFVKICKSCWTSSFDSLKYLPKQWIGDLLDILKSRDPSSALCATRRSAGVPFYISAICCTEPSINKRKTFHQVMTTLMEICSWSKANSTIEDNSKSQKVICLNILRALFRDSKFGEDVFTYVSEGLIIAIKGFSSSIWTIRNACTLLFSALMTRVFGVKKFPMSGTEFFSRFSPLYSFMKSEMDEVTRELDNQSGRTHLHPSVFPLLLLLSHLYSSSMDGNDSKMKLSAFVPHIIRCGDSGVYKSRAMTARALASIVTSGKIVETLQTLISALPKGDLGENINHNRINGCLLQIQYLLKEKIADNSCSPILRKEIISGPVVSLKNHTWLLSRASTCSFNKAILIEIINDTVMELQEQDIAELPDDQKNSINQLRQESLKCALFELGVENSGDNGMNSLTENIRRRTGHEILRKACSKFIQKYLTDHGESELKDETRGDPLDRLAIIQGLLTSEEHDVRKALAVWLGNGGRKFCENVFIVQQLQKRLLGKEDNIDCLVAICNALANCNNSKCFPSISEDGKSYSCLQVWEYIKMKIKDTGKRDDFHSSVRRLILIFVSSLLQELQKMTETERKEIFKSISEMFNFVKNSCNPEENPTTRMKAAEVIGNHVFVNLFTDRRIFDNQDGKLIFDYWKCIVDLLQDEDDEIRSLIAASVFQFIQNEYPTVDQPAFLRCQKLPAGYGIQPSYTLQLIIKTVSNFYKNHQMETCNFLMSLTIGCSADDICLITEKARLLKSKESSRNDATQRAVIFRQGDANTYFEELTTSHIAFEELQTMICLHSLGPNTLDEHFPRYVSLSLKKWSHDIAKFYSISEVTKSCQIIMGLCVLLSMDLEGRFLQLREDFRIFCRKLDQCLKDGHGFITSGILLNHLNVARWLCSN